MLSRDEVIGVWTLIAALFIFAVAGFNRLPAAKLREAEKRLCTKVGGKNVDLGDGVYVCLDPTRPMRLTRVVPQ